MTAGDLAVSIAALRGEVLARLDALHERMDALRCYEHQQGISSLVARAEAASVASTMAVAAATRRWKIALTMLGVLVTSLAPVLGYLLAKA